jgi:transposase-like protein
MSDTDDIENVRNMSSFKWSPKATIVAMALANGETHIEAATRADIADRTVRRWLESPEFSAEVDRLTLLIGIATRAERIRLAMRVVRQKTQADGTIETKADTLDWLKFAQSETDGSKSDLAEQLAAILSNQSGTA